ncbi:BTB/POZ domain-containing protein At5g66560 [Linum grandiflorum]
MADREKPSKGQAWFCSSGLPSDIVIEVDDMSFHLRKHPLMSKSRKLHQLITEQETNQVECQISLPDFPGGSETFEMVAKFCYGVKIDLSSSTVVPLRCAAELLEMTEEYSEDNLISRTDRFFSQSVLKSLKDSIKALKSCERVMPVAETLGIPHRCIESLASRASAADPALFGWPVTEGFSNDNNRDASNQALCVDSWFEDLALLSLPMFNRLISTMKERDLSPEIVESCLIYYARRHIPGISRHSRKPPSALSSSIASEAEQREALESIVSNLPLQKSSRSSTATRFLIGLLRTANILSASQSCRAALEKKIGTQLEQATLDDLLIPSYSYLNETLYDVDCVERILSYFLDGLDESSPGLMLVGKLIDGYLAEIASDANLKPERFYKLAMSLPEKARLFDDGLYRAVDVYLKAHPWITETEREKICGVMECQKLTLEACTHAAQNERLPLRAVVQVLFFEQLQLRHAIAGTMMTAEEGAMVNGKGGKWRETVRENQVLQLDMDSMRTRVNQLEKECSSMKKVIEKIGKDDGGTTGEKQGRRGSLTKKFGCKLKTQVCDSHEQAVVGTRKGRQRHHQD